jgi:hypothetical protein
VGNVDLTPAQIALAVTELLFLLFGGYLIFRQLGTGERRTAFLAAGGLPSWPLTGLEVTLLVLMVFFCGAVGQTLAGKLFAARMQASPDREGLSVAVLGASFHGLALLGWPCFLLLRRYLVNNYGPEPDPAPVEPPRRKLSWLQVLGYAVCTLAMALPLVAGVNFLWANLLHVLGLPDQPQDLIAIFGGGHSRWVFAGMLAVACLLAPVNEELLFRAALFRSLRQRFGRVVGLTFSGAFFGAMHGNLAGAVPLALFGMTLALAYERTGDIRVSMVTHGLFNLNTIVIVLAGFPQ